MNSISKGMKNAIRMLLGSRNICSVSFQHRARNRRQEIQFIVASRRRLQQVQTHGGGGRVRRGHALLLVAGTP